MERCSFLINRAKKIVIIATNFHHSCMLIKLYLYLFLGICGPPPIPKNSKVQTKSSEFGLSEATYECDSGYEIFGPSTIKCDSVKGWEKELPFCGKYKSALTLRELIFSIEMSY